MRRALLSVLVSVLMACGGSDGGDARPTGPVGATGPSAVTPVDSLSFGGEGVCVSGTSSVGISMVAVFSADVSNLCTMMLANQSKANSRAIMLMIVRGALNTPPGVPPGKYTITQDPTGTTVVTLAAAAVDSSDASCAGTTVDATSGTIWLDCDLGGAGHRGRRRHAGRRHPSQRHLRRPGLRHQPPRRRALRRDLGAAGRDLCAVAGPALHPPRSTFPRRKEPT